VPGTGAEPGRSDLLPTISFGAFALDRRAGRLWRDRDAIPLRPKTWAVLSYLVERPGVLVAGDELLDAIWPGVSVTPDTLSKSIGELRRALNDDARIPRFIETVHRRGFRFVAAVGPTPSTSPASDAPALETSAPAARPRLAGRSAELDALDAALAKARAGARQIVFVSGSAGIGKTALVEAFLHHVADRRDAASVCIASGVSIEHHGPREPYLPFLEGLDRICRGADAERVLDLLRRNAPTWLAQLPWLIADGDAEPLRRSLQFVGADRMLREFCSFLEAYTAERTLVLVLEDLHWTDPASVDLIAMLARRPEPASLLVIGTYRPADAAASDHVVRTVLRELKAHRLCRELPLQDLGEDAVRDYLDARFPGAEFPAELAPLIHQHTDGHPLFVVAVVDQLSQRGWIVDTEPGWALSAPVDGIDLGVPDDIWRAIVDQFEAMSPSDRRLLEAASVVGTQFAPQLVAKVLELDVGEAEARCDELARGQRFLRAAGRVEWPDGSVARRYAFTHDLYRQVVYDVIPDRRRAELHHRAGIGLEQAYGTQVRDIAVSLALHFERSHDARRAVPFLLVAGRRARERFASREAIDLFRTALALIEQLPEMGERWRQELELRLALGGGLSDVHGFASDEVRENVERMSELVVEVGTPAQRFDVLYARWYLHAIRADREGTLADVDELAQVAEQLGTEAARSLLVTVRVRTALYAGRVVEVRRFMDEHRMPLRDLGARAAPPGYGVDPWLAATSHYAQGLWFLGHAAEAQQRARTNLAEARAMGQPLTLAGILVQAAVTALLCRDAASAAELAEQAISLCRERGFPFWHANAAGVRGWSRAQQGDLQAGSEEIRAALDSLRATGAWLFATCMLAFLAECSLRMRRREDGLAAVSEGLELASAKLDCGYEPELWRLRGELLLLPVAGRRRAAADADGAEAERCLLRALELARGAEARSVELRATVSLARAWAARERAADARALLEGVCAWFAAETETPDLIDARRLLAAI
jgi:DNA-binding winged helix-turn-helix (wHTH) protein